MRALVVGGTGPTGPHIVTGLRDRGYEVTVFHRGTHERPELATVEHLHGDPHFRDTIEAALAGRTFDLVVAAYGRLGHLAAALRGRCGRFVAVGGVPVYEGFFPRPGRRLPIPVTEEHPVVRSPGGDPALTFSHRLAQAEDAVFAAHPGATILRFSTVYGPHNPRPHEWSIVRRVRDGRPHMILPDGGLQVHTRCAAPNAAAFVLAAVDRPDAAAGRVYNCGDPVSWSFRDWAELVLDGLGAELELVAIPAAIAVEAAAGLLFLGNTAASHCIVSTERARRELQYVPVVEPEQALRATLEWYEANRDVDFGQSPSLTDRFDYATEDALIAAYRDAGARLAADVVQQPPPPVHSMPHPRAPGARDDRGR